MSEAGPAEAGALAGAPPAASVMRPPDGARTPLAHVVAPGEVAASGAAAAPVERAEQGRTGSGTFHAFRYHDYRWLWLGNTFSSAAMWVQQTTMGYITYDLTGSGSLLGAINSLRHFPPLFAAPIAGVAADRYSRNTVVAITQGLLFITALAIAGAIAFDVLEVWHLFAFTLVASILNAFNQPARQTMVFDVVPREVAPNAIALNSIAGNATRTLGPMVGGALIVFFGPANNFLIQSLAYLGVVVTVFMIQKFPPRQAAARRRPFLKEMAEGYSWALNNPRARLLVLMMTLYPAFIIPVHSALMPIFAKEIFHTDAGGLGLLLSALGAGGLVGGFLTARLNVDRRGMLQLWALFMVSGFLAAYGLIGGWTHNLAIGIFLLVMSGIGGAVLNTTNQTVLQLLAPDRMRGRITGILTVQPVFSSVGILISGACADIFGPEAVAMGFGSTMFAIGILILVFSPRMRGLRLSRLGDETD